MYMFRSPCVVDAEPVGWAEFGWAADSHAPTGSGLGGHAARHGSHALHQPMAMTLGSPDVCVLSLGDVSVNRSPLFILHHEIVSSVTVVTHHIIWRDRHLSTRCAVSQRW